MTDIDLPEIVRQRRALHEIAMRCMGARSPKIEELEKLEAAATRYRGTLIEFIAILRREAHD